MTGLWHSINLETNHRITLRITSSYNVSSNFYSFRTFKLLGLYYLQTEAKLIKKLSTEDLPKYKMFLMYKIKGTNLIERATRII